jgi:hypothetical protein
VLVWGLFIYLFIYLFRLIKSKRLKPVLETVCWGGWIDVL